MFNLIPLSLLITALAGVIYIVSDHLSEFEENDEAADSGFSFRAKFAGWISQLPLDNVKSYSLSFTQKLLHRMRIVLLKTDNYLMKLIGRISKSEKDKMINNNGSNGDAADFWKDISNYKQEVSNQKNPKPEPEVKINLVFKTNPETKKFFNPVRNGAKKVDGILTNHVSNGVDIKPAKKTSRTKKL